MRRTKEEERIQFSERLKKAFSLKSGERDYGKYSRLAKEFGVTAAAVKKWFEGESIPISRINVIADYFKVRAEWLLSNKGPMKELTARTPDGKVIDVEMHQVPVVEPENYAEWKAGLFSVSKYVLYEGDISLQSFAFELQDSSAAPYAIKGLTAIVDPENPTRSDPGSKPILHVVYDQGAYMIGKLISRGGLVIEPENDDYPPVQLSDNYEFVGYYAGMAPYKH